MLLASLVTSAFAGVVLNNVGGAICTTKSEAIELSGLVTDNGVAVGTISSIAHNSTEVRDGVTYYLTDHGEYTRSGTVITYTATAWVNESDDRINVEWSYNGNTYSTSVTRTVDKCNEPPWMVTDLYLDVCEVWEFDLLDYVVDPEGDDIVVVLDSQVAATGGSLVIDGTSVTVTPPSVSTTSTTFLYFDAWDSPAGNMAENLLGGYGMLILMSHDTCSGP